MHTRKSRVTYGIMCSFDFDKGDPEHQKRSANVFLAADGKPHIRGGFNAVLEKVNVQFRSKYYVKMTKADGCRSIRAKRLLKCHRFGGPSTVLLPKDRNY